MENSRGITKRQAVFVFGEAAAQVERGKRCVSHSGQHTKCSPATAAAAAAAMGR